MTLTLTELRVSWAYWSVEQDKQFLVAPVSKRPRILVRLSKRDKVVDRNRTVQFRVDEAESVGIEKFNKYD